MKILFSFIILTVLLFGRANPFEATDTYNEKKQMLLAEQERLEQEEREQKLEESRKTLDKMALKQQEIIEENEAMAREDEPVMPDPMPKVVKKESMVKKPMVKEERKPKPTINIVEKVMEKPEPKKEVVKQKVKIVKVEVIDPLPFVTLKISDNNVEVLVDKKYKFINQMILHKKKKFIFDFKGKVRFYTKRKKLNNSYFKSIAIGNHPKKGFFRVVVEVKDNIEAYKEKIKNDKCSYSISKI